MKKQIVFATNNAHKLDEIRHILGEAFQVKSLSDIGCHEDIPEEFDTLEDNALQKASYVHDKYHVDCFADDTGLEVEALNGEPGVHSARYAEGTDTTVRPIWTSCSASSKARTTAMHASVRSSP